ncbi:hypothetical protein FA09DRAFT_358299 [Tilletiopsis washingtonensis]|uniref:RRM domain-containing protein n=1 Tax=Tilletiopsis washingtonensis TaxID=58919 RepID=A0A316ZGQ5_9BASI|nr:hypothetical protein FA09DRAFT_358299 [Tilletiopsis washingtonensis]PWO00951.1 hypothetical protein FA09DRAFT_358299 [Tilletiopsis washingtonensis]
MNNIRSTAKLNERELELGLEGASWHDEFKDSAYIFVGGLPTALTEGDVITIFSQYGEILDISLPRSKETGARRGFGFLMYEDQRSTVLAVDNLNGAVVLDRTLRVDHVREYRGELEKDEQGNKIEKTEPSRNAAPPLLEAGSAHASSSSAVATRGAAADVDLEDPMAAYIARERAKERQERSLSGGGGGSSRAEKEEKRRRKEERARIREERERRKARGESSRHRSRSRSKSPRPSARDDRPRRDRDSREREVRRTDERDRDGRYGRERDERRDRGGDGGRDREQRGSYERDPRR